MGLREQFEDLLIFDALVYNTDRHLNNYGFLRDNDTYNVVGMAPIFDNGCGMLPYYTLDRDIDEYAKKYDYQNSGLSNDDIFALCLKDRHKKILSRLIDFTFPKHPLFDLPEERSDSRTYYSDEFSIFFQSNQKLPLNFSRSLFHMRCKYVKH